jgi:N-methylhydantoinase B
MPVSETFDVLTLERAWTRLASIAEEADASVMRTAFSSIIRDSHDYSCAIYDARGYLISQPGFVSAGHLGGMTAAMLTLNNYFPFDTLVEGDAIITNDPWIMSGHLPDILVTTPVFITAAWLHSPAASFITRILVGASALIIAKSSRKDCRSHRPCFIAPAC